MLTPELERLGSSAASIHAVPSPPAPPCSASAAPAPAPPLAPAPAPAPPACSVAESPAPLLPPPVRPEPLWDEPQENAASAADQEITRQNRMAHRTGANSRCQTRIVVDYFIAPLGPVHRRLGDAVTCLGVPNARTRSVRHVRHTSTLHERGSSAAPGRVASTETWTETRGTACECTHDFVVACEGRWQRPPFRARSVAAVSFPQPRPRGRRAECGNSEKTSAISCWSPER